MKRTGGRSPPSPLLLLLVTRLSLSQHKERKKGREKERKTSSFFFFQPPPSSHFPFSLRALPSLPSPHLPSPLQVRLARRRIPPIHRIAGHPALALTSASKRRARRPRNASARARAMQDDGFAFRCFFFCSRKKKRQFEPCRHGLSRSFPLSSPALLPFCCRERANWCLLHRQRW